MNTAAYYAKALFELSEAHPEKGGQYLKNLRASLQFRGHEKLMPNILSEYERLAVQKARTLRHRKTTPEMERTEKLLQLYRKLISN